jgi:NADP-dependent 3-hydroxy acid dehydrogenase YdfG
LDERVVVITGAGSGLGAGFARAMAAAGGTLVLAARRVDRIEALAEQLRTAGASVLTHQADVANQEDCERLAAAAAAAFGRIDVLVNNAGIGPAAPALREDPEVFRQVIDTKVKSLQVV